MRSPIITASLGFLKPEGFLLCLAPTHIYAKVVSAQIKEARAGPHGFRVYRESGEERPAVLPFVEGDLA
jgi:hypothetical protein